MIIIQEVSMQLPDVLTGLDQLLCRYLRKRKGLPVVKVSVQNKLRNVVCDIMHIVMVLPIEAGN